jgi:hypothetical protein
VGVVADPPRKSIRTVVLDLFPWLARIRISAIDGGLCVRAAGKMLHLGGDKGDPPAARVGDVAGFEYLEVTVSAGNVVAVTLHRSAANGTASSWSSVAGGPLPPVDGVTSGTPVTITTGSGKVTVA